MKNKRVESKPMTENIIFRVDTELKNYIRSKCNENDITMSQYFKKLIAFDIQDNIFQKKIRKLE